MNRVAYVLAASHSGSTLLSLLLASHPQMATVGELKLSAGAMGDLDRYRCSCGRLIRACGFWQQVQDGMAVRGFDFDLARAGTDYRISTSPYARCLLGPAHRGRFLEGMRDLALGWSRVRRQELGEIHRRNAALVSVVGEIQKAEVIVDSSKIALRLKYLLRNPELDVKVIRLLRDGRAVALTYMDPAGFADARDPTCRGGGMGNGREPEHLSMATAAHRWRRCMQEAETIAACLSPAQWIEVRYEDYCREPQAALRRLHRFLGVEPNKRIEDSCSRAQHVVGNGMRLDRMFEVRLDERWRQELNERDLRAFDRIAGRMNRRYGYE